MMLFMQIALICLFSIFGEFISFGINQLFPYFFIPGSLFGMIFLFIFLYFKWIKLEQIETVGTFLIQNMGFFFIPLAVSVMDYFELLKSNLWKIILVCTISFLITFIAIALSVQFTLYLQERGKDKDAELNHK